MTSSNQSQNPSKNTPQNVISNAAQFNRQFIDKQIGGNPITVSLGKLLTVMGEQDNTIRVLSKALGQNHNDQELHDMHNSLFGGLVSGSGAGKEGMNLGPLLTQITTFINQQNQQIQTLIAKITQDIQQLTSKEQQSSS
ncbi:MAG TPA: hypothetical protein VN704_11580 [Verrucomicrobiae bacterium]|jgi:hypothetical protein|nr:hypothetical protein [Candidatus Sulfopaludibacter sp.]HXT84948.1 hypothetical protein [Verrucomicrobiae bacterium]